MGSPQNVRVQHEKAVSCEDVPGFAGYRHSGHRWTVQAEPIQIAAIGDSNIAGKGVSSPKPILPSWNGL